MSPKTEIVGWDAPDIPQKRPRYPTERPAVVGRKQVVQRSYAPSEYDVPGQYEYVSLRNTQNNQHRKGKPSSRKGVPDGMQKLEAARLWKIGNEQAQKDLNKLMKNFPEDFDENEIVKDAVQATLECMHSPLNNDMKLRAARQILEWFKAKPTSKQDITVNKAVEFLNGLEDGDDDHQDEQSED